MIIDYLLTFLSWLLLAVFSIFPRVTALPQTWQTTLDSVLPVLGVYNNLPVIGTAIIIGILVLTILSAWQLVVFANWFYNKLRGSG